MASSKVLLLIAVILVVAVYAQQETAQHEDLELAETKGKKHTRHIQPNNKPSPKRFLPRIRSPSGRGRSDSSESGGSEAGGEYDPNNDGYVIISYGGSLNNKGKKGQRYGNKYGSDYSVEVVGNVYGYEDDHGYHGGSYHDDGYHEEDNVKGSIGTGGGIGESTGLKGNSESTATDVDAGVSEVTSGKGESKPTKGNTGSMSESTGAGESEGSKGNIQSMVDATVTSGDAMGGEGSKDESMSEGTKGNDESMIDSTATGGDIKVEEEEAMDEIETMSEGSKGESMGEELTGGVDAGTMSEMESIGDVKEGDAMEGDGGTMDDMESMGEEVPKTESMDAGGDESGSKGSTDTSGSTMTIGGDAGGDGEKGSSETDNTGTKISAEVGVSAEESDYVVEVEITEDKELEDDASNKGNVIVENTSQASPVVPETLSTSSVTMEMEKATGTVESTSDLSAATDVSSSAPMGDKGMSIVMIDEMLKMAEMIKIDEMIKNGEMDKVDELIKNAEMIQPEVAKEEMLPLQHAVTMEMEKPCGDASKASSTSESTTPAASATNTTSAGQRRIGRNGNGSPERSGKQGNGDKRSIVVGKVAPATSTNRVKQDSRSVINKSAGSSAGSNKKPSNLPVNAQKVSQNAGSPRSKPVNNQGKPMAPNNTSLTNGNRESRRPSGNVGKVSSVHHPGSRAKKESVIPVGSKPVRSSPIRNVDKQKKLPGIGEKVNNSTGGKNSTIRPSVSSAPAVNTTLKYSTNTTSNNGTTNTTEINGERRFFSIGKGGITFGNRGKQEIGSGSGDKFINRGVRTSGQSKSPRQVMKPPSKPQANPMMGGMRPTFFTESRLKGETTTEKSVRNEKGSKTTKNSVKEKRGISISSSASSINSQPVSTTSTGNKGEKGSRGSSKGNDKKEIAISSTTESAPATKAAGKEKKGATASENGEKQISGFVRNASPLSIVRYLRKGVGRFL